MSADSEKPNITGGIWMKYCTVAKSMGRERPISVEVNGCMCARRLRSPAGLITSDRHILDSRCADRCANDAVFDFGPSHLKGALSHYSVIFCTILLWGKIMAAVRFSIVAVLHRHRIRLCVDRLDADSSVRGGPMFSATSAACMLA